ncbi:ABC transporter permease [Streptomyces sp. ST2-7A]|uniref:ABC transporter permease n=1 Tax=Streptomyces sp. ST2-7A TaxID=2907214 RepID=UPI001F2A4B01|nr:ABC transporter permease [Streptomyces sp. ST2-7A]MCE7082871.1 ABC transporter permease [Streptomyces sp. ST2-7A]
MAMARVGLWPGPLVRTPDTVGVIVFPPAFPLAALSNVLVAPELMPGWLATISAWNPLSATVAACREIFGDPGAGGESWPAAHAPLPAVVWPLAVDRGLRAARGAPVPAHGALTGGRRVRDARNPPGVVTPPESAARVPRRAPSRVPQMATPLERR